MLSFRGRIVVSFRGLYRPLGRDPFNHNFRKFRSKPQWIGSVQPEKFRKNGSTFWGGPLFPVGPVGILLNGSRPQILNSLVTLAILEKTLPNVGWGCGPRCCQQCTGEKYLGDCHQALKAGGCLARTKLPASSWNVKDRFVVCGP